MGKRGSPSRSRSRGTGAKKLQRSTTKFADGPPIIAKRPRHQAEKIPDSDRRALQDKDQTPALELRLGCFELPEVKQKAPARGPRCSSDAEPGKAPAAKTDTSAEISAEQSPQAPQAGQKAQDESKGRAETTNESQERREREYFKASYGDPCGPGNRFLIEGDLGKGSFSTVFRCRDTKGQGKEFAIKFIRANTILQKATEREVKLMRRLRNQASEKDPEGAVYLLALAGPEFFEHEGHLALVFHLQRCDMRSELYITEQGRGLSLLDIQRYARNIFMALRALRRIRVIHNDLKPDNLLLSLDKMSVKLSDFGNAVELEDPDRVTYVRPTYCSSYRAPELVLGQKYSTRVDIWSAGVTLFELATGQVLFAGQTNNSIVHGMLQVSGAFPKKFAISGKHAEKHFTADGDFRRKRKDGESGSEVVMAMSRFPRPSLPTQSQLQEAALDRRGLEMDVHQALMRRLASLMAVCLTPDPGARIAPEAALEHRFLKKDT